MLCVVFRHRTPDVLVCGRIAHKYQIHEVPGDGVVHRL